MQKKPKLSLYEQLVEITLHYLGPAADRFVRRQIVNHLKKEPEQLVKKDLRELMDWIEIAMQLVTNDEKLVREYISELKTISKGPSQIHADKKAN